MAGRAWADGEYSRIYWSIVDDPKFVDAYADDRLWAAYTRLLMTAEQAYPAPAALPRWLAEDVQASLVEARIIETVGRASYRVIGLRSEREGRQSGRRAGGLARVAGASRDDLGRLLPGSDAGDAGDPLADAGDPRWASNENPASPAKTRRGQDETRRGSSPLPPASGGRRSEGTNPRALAEAEAEAEAEALKARRWRRSQRRLAVMRGAMSEEERDRMNAVDAPLKDIPDWDDYQARLKAESASPVEAL